MAKKVYGESEPDLFGEEPRVIKGTVLLEDIVEVLRGYGATQLPTQSERVGV